MSRAPRQQRSDQSSIRIETHHSKATGTIASASTARLCSCSAFIGPTLSGQRAGPPNATEGVDERGGVKGCVAPPRQDSVELIRFPSALSQKLRKRSRKDAVEPGDGDRTLPIPGTWPGALYSEEKPAAAGEVRGASCGVAVSPLPPISQTRCLACRRSRRGCGTSDRHPPRSSRCRWPRPRGLWA